MNNLQNVDISALYKNEYICSKQDFILRNNISEAGLTSDEVNNNLNKYGLNIFKKSKDKKWYNFFLQSLFSPFNSILLGISLVLLYTDVLLVDIPNYSNIIVIIILVLASTFLEFFQEYRSNKASLKLRNLVATTTTVLRDGKKEKVPNAKITLNDTVILSAGDLIPADLRIIEAKDLYVSQSSLTGESEAVRKVSQTENNIEKDLSITDLDTICFMGTNVISGSAKGVVIKLAKDTYFSKIADSINAGKTKTAFQIGIENISKLLIRFMLVMIPLTFILNAWKHDVLTSFTFAVAIAIGITPLLLPVILSSSLSKGAIRMSLKKTIVKKLDSIQNFGGMNILCTDKTGTLTEDKIVLEKYLNVYGQEDFSVLEYAYLNAYFQTGLKGNIDEAIINKANEKNLNNIQNNYLKIDEIPFDFSRRRLSVIVSRDNETQIITKGAVEEILNICSSFSYNGIISDLNSNIKENIKKIAKILNKDGLRVVAVCNKISNEKTEYSVKDESKMTLLGFIGFLDPPKASAKEAILSLNKYGIRVIVLTGDNAEVTKSICDKVDINTTKIVTGTQVDKLTDMALFTVLKKVNVFAKLSPIQKARIIRILKNSGNVVGYMGDGINDSPSLTNTDVGISVDTAVDIAKETADIILLEKDLNVLLDGVLEGRRTFGNLMKYIKMAVSFNFGEVLSVLIASVLLPFLPITPIQLLVQSLLYDIGQLALPFDNVDKDYLTQPRQLNMSSIKRFMLYMGPLSSCFDLLVFAILWFGFNIRTPALFQTIWFSYGVVSNLVGLHIIRTSKIPFIQSNASLIVYIFSITLSIIAIIVPATFLGNLIGLVSLPYRYLSIIILIPLLYCIIAMLVKRKYILKFNEWV